MPRQIWRHDPSGCKFAVETDNKGKVVSVSTDLHYSELRQALDHGFENEPEQVEWVRENIEQFFVHNLRPDD